MKIVASILVLVFLFSCEPKLDQKNKFSQVIYESKTEITIKIGRDKFQIDAPSLNKPGTRKLRYLRKVIISNHSNKVFLVGSNLPEHKVATSSILGSYSTIKNEWTGYCNECKIDTFFYELFPNEVDTFQIIDPLTDSDSALFSLEIHEKGLELSEPKKFYVSKSMLQELK